MPCEICHQLPGFEVEVLGEALFLCYECQLKLETSDNHVKREVKRGR